jgi:uncharacterized membrane protein
MEAMGAMGVDASSGWIITTAYALHMLATVVWIGGIAFQAVLLLPVALPLSSSQTMFELNQKLWRRFQPLAWLSLAVLTGTGLMQMAANPNYVGFFNVENRWSVAILLKHIAIAGMVALLAYQSWFLQPGRSRQELRRALTSEGAAENNGEILRQDRRLSRIHLVLSIIILILTAIARTA